jgi:hypothetical protein
MQTRPHALASAPARQPVTPILLKPFGVPAIAAHDALASQSHHAPFSMRLWTGARVHGNLSAALMVAVNRPVSHAARLRPRRIWSPRRHGRQKSEEHGLIVFSPRLVTFRGQFHLTMTQALDRQSSGKSAQLHFAVTI